jgi:Family of unknown function (DUF5329)
MYRQLKHFVSFSVLVTLILPAAVATATDEMLLRSINHLLTYVEESNCVFIRNGKEHDSKEAAKHMKTKYDYFMFNIKTPEEFIEKAASKSIISSQLYWVRCADHSPIPSAEWLTQELTNYRNTMHDNSFAK